MTDQQENYESYTSIEEMRAAMFASQPAPKQNIFQRAAAWLINLVVSVSRWTTNPGFFDNSAWNVMDWDAIFGKHPEIIGTWVKGGEVGEESWTANPAIFKQWKSTVVDATLDALYKWKKWAGVYFFLNTSRWHGGDHADYRKLDDGTLEERIHHAVYDDPEVHLIIMVLKAGLAAVFPPDWRDVAAKPNKRVHAIGLDLEKWWKYYPIPKAPRPDQIIDDMWIGDIAGGTARRLQLVMDAGILPQMPIVFYSGRWYIDRYCPLYGATVLEKYDSWVAGYYNFAAVVTTLSNFLANILAQIPDAWRPAMFGGAVAGKQVVAIQVTGDRIKIPECTNGNNTPSAIDYNVAMMGLAGWKVKFPLWTDYGDVPPVEPPPAPIETVTIGTTTRPVNLRKDPSTNQPAITLLPVGTRVIIVGTEVKGADIWRQVHYSAWVADVVGGTDYLTVTEEPKVTL